MISNLPTPKCVRDIRSFLGQAGFYRRFIKDFSAIALPLCTLFAKDVPFTWSQACEIAFTKLKNMLVSPPIMRFANWDLPFEIMCDASDHAIGAVLGQREDKKAFVIYYASKTLDFAQANYTTTEKEFLAVVFALEKFRSYILGSPVTIFTDHAALKYLLSKQDTKPPLTRWILLCQEFNLTIKDKKGVENVVADHLSRLVPESNSHDIPIGDSFPDEQLFSLAHCPWYADIVNYLVTGQIPSQWTSQQKKKFWTDIKKYYFDDPYLFKYCPDQIMRRCVPNDEHIRILTNYTTTEKEFLAVVFSLEKFRSYIVGSPVTIFTDHAALKYLLSKQDTKPRLTRWILLCQEFNLTIKDKKGVENVVADHLSRLVPESNSHDIPIGNSFPDEQLFALAHCPWYADIVNYLVTGQIPSQWTSQQKKKFWTDIKKYYFDDPYLFKYCPDQIMRRCVPNDEHMRILTFCHSEACGGHFSAWKTADKILQAGFYWPTLFKNCFEFCKTYTRCEQLGGITKRNMMPLTPILIIEIFDCWGIDFMGPFPPSCGYLYILLSVDYVSKWVKAIPTRTNDHKLS